MIGNIHDIDIRLLRVFHAVAKFGGFTAAQAHLNISQSAISNKMSQLEQRLGMRLCERGSNRFRLTDQGQMVLRATVDLFQSLEKFRSDIASAEQKVSGNLHIGLADNSVTQPGSHICESIKRLDDVSLELSLSVYVGTGDELTSRLIDGSLHLAISHFSRKLDGLTYTPLFTEEQELYCSRRHPLFSREDGVISDVELADYAYACWDGYINDHAFLLDAKHASHTPCIEGVAYLVLSGCHISHLPTHYAEQWVKKGELRKIETERSAPMTPFEVAQKKGITQPLVVKRFLEFLTELYALN